MNLNFESVFEVKSKSMLQNWKFNFREDQILARLTKFHEISVHYHFESFGHHCLF